MRRNTITQHGCSRKLAGLLMLAAVFYCLPVHAQSSGQQGQPMQNQAMQDQEAPGQQTRPPWRGLEVPNYPGATGVQVKTDSDEYKLSFQTDDEVRKVFDFYLNYLRQQGFSTVSTKEKTNASKAKLRRQSNQASEKVELEAKRRRNHTVKVEIDFDD